ncbi:hypothetical protein H2199_006499 [Coniosporium tulheliwenetii]|uniref:Uncharacterized protein n=1 Tax=Coniosporium tulheliwenetii TaxID=3383036 RepID=A0ACC2YVU1_9PEZI|nr:hypothetical protein H2199_006499 [Cladosporium sp. JES 115]
MSLNGLSENIFLLEKITKVPEIAHENPLPAQFHRSQGPRALRLEHEQSIVSALSFLSSYTDDGNKVSALCIEETPDRRGLVVSIAANSGELEKLKAGLEGFASILMNEATDAEALRKLQVLQAVPIKTIHGLELITQDLVALFGELERMDRTQALSQEVDRCLLSILRISSQLNTEYRLDDILDTIPQGDNSFPDSRKTSMVEGFRKLSLYVTLSPGLLRFARKLPVFQDILVRAVEVRPTLPNGLRKGSAGTVPEGLLRQHISHRTPARNKTIKRFEHRLGASLADVQADLRKKSLGSKRIHAEIQLLFYYEQQPEIQLRPRAIQSGPSSRQSPPTRFHTSRIHVELSYDQALSIASTDDLLQQDSDEVEAKAEVQVCAEWLSGEETEIINDRPGEVDLAAAWTCKRLDGALLNSDGLLLRKGKDLLKLSVEAS